jgi:hypothetical protein
MTPSHAAEIAAARIVEPGVSSPSSPDFGNLTLLISHDRSGSHYLGSYIRALANCRMIDEVCNEDALDPATNPLSFFGFRHRRAQDEPNFELRRKPQTVSRLLDEYFGFVLQTSSPKAPVVDIKYGHVHNFEIAWWPIFRKPFLFEYVKSRRIRIVHLFRWNSLETVVSGYVAESRKQWHAIGDKQPAEASDAIVVNLSNFAEQIAMLNSQKAAFGKWMQGIPALNLTYEELVDGEAGTEARARVAQFLKSPVPAEFTSPYRKVTPEAHLIVQNWTQLEDYCRENGLAHYLVPQRRL